MTLPYPSFSIRTRTTCEILGAGEEADVEVKVVEGDGADATNVDVEVCRAVSEAVVEEVVVTVWRGVDSSAYDPPTMSSAMTTTTIATWAPEAAAIFIDWFRAPGERS